MTININTMSAKELESLISQARKRKTTLSKRKPLAQVRARIARTIQNEGYTIEELFGAGMSVARAPRAAKGTKSAAPKARKAMGKVAPKYRNTENAQETWTGRGKQPRWLAAHTNAGRKLEEFVIS